MDNVTMTCMAPLATRGFCSRELLGHEHEPMSTASALCIALVGLWTFTWEHKEPVVKLTSALYVVNGLSSAANHYTASTVWSFVDGMSMVMVVWVLLALMAEELMRQHFQRLLYRAELAKLQLLHADAEQGDWVARQKLPAGTVRIRHVTAAMKHRALEAVRAVGDADSGQYLYLKQLENMGRVAIWASSQLCMWFLFANRVMGCVWGVDDTVSDVLGFGVPIFGIIGLLLSFHLNPSGPTQTDAEKLMGHGESLALRRSCAAVPPSNPRAREVPLRHVPAAQPPAIRAPHPHAARPPSSLPFPPPPPPDALHDYSVLFCSMFR